MNAAGEIIPQALCSRFGLQIGAYSAWFVRILLWVVGIVSFPISKVLDYLLGSEHGVSNPMCMALRCGRLALPALTSAPATANVGQLNTRRIVLGVNFTAIGKGSIFGASTDAPCRRCLGERS